MKHLYFSSDKIKRIEWEYNVLEVEFKDGSIYQYHNVSEAELRVLMDSESIHSGLLRIMKIHSYNRIERIKK
ncbi:KTSC domain-containing protein [Enterococcus innesii]|uniref:KTSC domain-containing protein n=1 Tax=Enterococcus innesii TaxID=2839759 RepID=UPI003A4C5232